MLNPLKDVLRKSYLARHFKKQVDTAASVDFSTALGAVEKVLVILKSDPESGASVGSFIQKLSRLFDGGHVSTFSMDSLRKEDMNWLDIPRPQYLQSIQSEQYDLVIDLAGDNSSLSSFITGLSGAPLRLNLYEGEYNDVYNLHFRMAGGRSLVQHLDNIIRYLDTLKRSEN